MALETLRDTHVEALQALTDIEDWDYAPDDLTFLLRHAGGCGRAHVDDATGEMVSAALGFPWGPVGFIGAVITHPDARGKGLGAEVTGAVLDALRGKGCETVRLLAAPLAVPLYRRLGFVGEREALLIEGTAPRPHGTAPPALEDAGRLAELEERATGMRRPDYLGELLDRAPPGASAWHEATGSGLLARTQGFPVLGPFVSEAPAAGTASDLFDHVGHAVGSMCQVIVYGPRFLRPCWGEITGRALLMRHGPPTEGRAGDAGKAATAAAAVAAGGEESG